MQRAQSRRLAPTEADAYGPASIDLEIRGIRFRLPHYGIIRDDHSCSRLKFISELVSEIGTKAQSRRQSLGIDRAPFVGHPHPSRLFVVRGEWARRCSSCSGHS